MVAWRRLLIVGGWFAIGLLTVPSAALGQPAPNAHPTGGAVVAGSGSISQSASTTTIDQSSQRVAINWRSFNVGSQQTVDVVQPSASAVALMRVSSPNPSQVAGRIDSNGQVIIVNQTGITFDKGAQANSSGLVLSAAGINNKDFMAGRMVFDQAAHPNAVIFNAGQVTIKQAGLLAALAPAVQNSGVIEAKLGHVELVGAKTATLDLYGDGLVDVSALGAVTQAPVGPSGHPLNALVRQTGTVQAQGGTVEIAANAADGVVQDLESVSGIVSAHTIGTDTGTVTIDGAGGSAVVGGRVGAVGGVGADGGGIAVDAAGGVVINATAQLNASGGVGGGAIALGTTLARAKGGPSVAAGNESQNVTVARGAAVAANATVEGDGGNITVLSANETSFAGSASAMGGRHGGNGGRIELSSQGTLALTGTTNVSAPLGQQGTILLDPRRLIH
jgi:filamentous hemagglutinin family protein